MSRNETPLYRTPAPLFRVGDLVMHPSVIRAARVIRVGPLGLTTDAGTYAHHSEFRQVTPPQHHATVPPATYQQDLPALDLPPIPAAQQDRGFYYLASPYSKCPAGLNAAFLLAVHATGLLMRAGVPVYSPIVHSHPIAVNCEMDPLDHGIWMPMDRPMMAAAKALVMLTAEGWLSSKGMEEEERTFRNAGKQVVYMKPGVVPEGLT